MTNDFKLLKVIGKGGFSKVYMGKYIFMHYFFYLLRHQIFIILKFITLLTLCYFIVRKKDTGFIYAMKVMKKDQVTNESKLK